jgi:hypothetical protein
MVNLFRLDLEKTRVIDDGLTHLKGITSLGELDLTSTQISDVGLALWSPTPA